MATDEAGRARETKGVASSLARREVLTLRILTETASLVALAGALHLFKIFSLPQGGSVTLGSMIPVLLLSLRRGWRVGIPAGFVFGLIAMFEEPWGVYYPTQAVLDYPVAFSALGLAGFFRRLPYVGVGVAVLGRFVSHFVSGIIFFASFAPAGMSPEIYSAVYNSFLIPEFFISLIVIFILVRFKKLELYM